MRPLSLLLLVLASCTSSTSSYQAYSAAQQQALRQPTPAYAALGLRFDMDSLRVGQHLDSLQQRDELAWQLRTGRLPLLAEPAYVRGRLARLTLHLQGSGLLTSPEYGELLSGLNQAYGQGYEHSPGEEGGVRSWFTGGQEVCLMNIPGGGYSLQYSDLGQAHALAEGLLHRDEQQLRQMEQEQDPR